MKIAPFQALLRAYPEHELVLVLPDGGRIPVHAHVTEVGRVDKRFMDCGGTVRHTATCLLQTWVADDLEHRLAPGKLAGVMERAAELFTGEDLEVEVEYEDGFISQFPVIDGGAQGAALVFQLGTKHTDCLAKEMCLPAAATAAASGCCFGTGCC